MKEKYESLPLVQLRELAKVRGLKGTSSMKKADLVEAMLAEDERIKKLEAEKAPKREEAQQTGEAEPVRKKGVVTNKRSSASPQHKDRAQKMVKDESSDKAEPAAPAEKTKKADEPAKAPATPQSAPSQTAAAPSQAAPTGAQASGQSAPAPAAAQPAAPQRPTRSNEVYDEKTYPKELDSGEEASGILEVMPDGYGFIRCENYLPGE